eukprot:CAMPEP_0181093002 /NCGR_PEP_ID=MMETSP1071-20121207/9216_1 /TAXON_ID=35127 /ORGANISM="Thalassiosira sp., Strain NH16" /LENGTH=249 /DNA_ID=CAMNT_0023175213 /DNA_START=77 /DNA_END=827 /DNA_ORIENTATION=-
MIFVSIIVAICLTSSSAAANSSEEAAAPASRRYLRASRGLRPNLTDVYPFAKRPKHGQSNDSVPLDFLDISQAEARRPEPDESENNARKLGRKKDNKKKKNKRDERKQEREADEVEDKKKKNKRDERKQEREADKVKDRKKKNKRDERKQKREREVEDPEPSGVTRNKRNFFVPLPDEGTNEDFAYLPFSDEGDVDDDEYAVYDIMNPNNRVDIDELHENKGWGPPGPKPGDVDYDNSKTSNCTGKPGC